MVLMLRLDGHPKSFTAYVKEFMPRYLLNLRNFYACLLRNPDSLGERCSSASRGDLPMVG